ncbi:MAG: Aspartyl/glutamyl-tRNA(Asn/Gln) amidotransferase subunit C [Parcubacteria group bacterium GW2011_GWC2_39_14]|nr:MAG: Aspartyl/glutamyl-tRNA(Asn/Gln) amidotransferase subunit C [Parcubacteria group bacterium GW2011_GWC2_39_14]KKR54803.1 MAG: Aspartyl/glutamyl-tRNA(Asn/Gln) amidotransferase subunit C [Parcubacteria group bacterium GW2011_GWA2_40_23]
MKLDKAQIEHLANLAKLDISEEEKEKYAEQLSSILEYVDKLNEIDTKNIEPLSQVSGAIDVLRPDVVKQCFSQEKVLAEVPDLEKRQIKVKKVFEHK